MTVHFIGAGPGTPDLITVRGLRLTVPAFQNRVTNESLVERADSVLDDLLTGVLRAAAQNTI